MKIGPGLPSDRLGGRKPIVVAGYVLSAIDKLLFPLADNVATVLGARRIDRLGKGIRDAPRDALLADITPEPVRGSRFGRRPAFYTAGWGLQLPVTQGQLSAAIAESSPERLGRRAFGFYEVTVGVTAYVATLAAGTLWEFGGPVLAFGASALIAGSTGIALLLRQMPRPMGATEDKRNG